MPPNPVCPFCGIRSNLDFIHRTEYGDEFRIWRCRHCHHGFLDPQPSFQELAKYYQDGYQCYEDSTKRVVEMVAVARKTGRLRHVQIRPGMIILDYGCGSGDFVLSAAALGAKAIGIEPSSLAVQRARQAGATVIEGTIETIDVSQYNSQFDLITLNHVLEHIPDPRQALDRLKSLLNPQGQIWIAVPNFACWGSRLLKARWHSSEIPRHLHHFTTSSLELCGQHVGLRLVSMETATLAYSMQNTIQSVLKYRARIPWRLTGLGRILERSVAPWAARKADSRAVGEAIIATFAT